MMGPNMMGPNFNMNQIDPLHVETIAPVHSNMQMPNNLLSSAQLANSLSNLATLNSSGFNNMGALSIDQNALQGSAVNNNYRVNEESQQLNQLVGNNMGGLQNLSALANLRGF